MCASLHGLYLAVCCSMRTYFNDDRRVQLNAMGINVIVEGL